MKEKGKKKFKVIVTPTIYSIGRVVRDPKSVEVVATAFSRFQEDYPNAKLVITLRPYFMFETSSYKRYIESFGVKNVEIYEHMNVPIRALFSHANYAISNVSTVLVECILNRIPTILLSGNPGLVDNFGKRECYIEIPTEVDDLVDALHSLKNKHTEDRLIATCDKEASYFNYNDDGKATDRIISHLREELNI